MPLINQMIEYERKQNVNKITKCRHEFKNNRCNGKVCAQFDHYPESRFGHSGWLSGLIYKQGQGVIWESSKQSAGQRVNNPFFNMPLTLPSSIKTNDLSAMRHGGWATLILFSWKKRCDRFLDAETVWNANDLCWWKKKKKNQDTWGGTPINTHEHVCRVHAKSQTGAHWQKHEKNTCGAQVYSGCCMMDSQCCVLSGNFSYSLLKFSFLDLWRIPDSVRWTRAL